MMKKEKNIKSVSLENWSEINGKLVYMQDIKDFYLLKIKYETIFELNINKKYVSKNIILKNYLDKEISIIKTNEGYRIR